MKEEIEIKQFSPCKEAIKFRKQYPDFESAWDNCRRGDWMLWIAKKLDVDILVLTTAKALCANTVRHLMKDERSIKAIDAALAFGKGLLTRDELRCVAIAAYDAADADADAYTSAAEAAYAAYDAADADADAYNASGAAYAAANAVDAGAKRENQLKNADICRQILTEEVLSKIKLLK